MAKQPMTPKSAGTTDQRAVAAWVPLMGNDLTAAPETLPAIAEKREQDRQRARRYRKRRARGEVCVMLCLPAAETEDLLIDRGLLTAAQADDPKAVAEAAETFVRGILIEDIERHA